MAKLTERQIAAILDQEISRAAGSDLQGGELTANRQDANDYIMGRKGGGEPPPGTSKYVSHDVGDAIDGIISEILPSFKGDVVARFEENGPDDQTAALESDVVAEFIMDRNPGVVELHNAIFNILAYKNGVMRVDLETQTESDTKVFKTPEAANTVAAMQEAQGMEATVSGPSVTVTRRRQRLSIENVDMERFLYSAQWRSLQLDGIPFCGELTYPVISDLKRLGVPKAKLDKLDTASPEVKADMVAKRVGGQTLWTDSQTRNSQEIRCGWFYRQMPAGLTENSDDSELWRFLFAIDSSTVLLKERADFLPYCAGAAWLVPGRFEGISAFDKLRPIADAKSDSVRQILENMRASNNCKVAHNERVDAAEVLNQRSAATIQVDGMGPVGDALMQLGPTPFISEGLAFLQYLDSVRTERVGASLDISSPEFQIAGDTAHGTERIMSSREIRSGKNATMIAETLVRGLWLLVHKTLRRQWTDPLMANQQGKWVQVDPAQWPERDRVNITHGISPGERVRKAQALGLIAQLQEKMLAGGLNGVLTGYPQIHNTLMDQGRAMGLEAPDRYFVDPESEAAQQAMKAAGEAAEAEKQAAVEAQDRLLSTEAEKVVVDREKIAADERKAQLDSDTKLAIAGISATTELEKADISAESSANSQGREARPNGSGG